MPQTYSFLFGSQFLLMGPEGLNSMIPNVSPNHDKNDKLQLSFKRMWAPFQNFHLEPRDEVLTCHFVLSRMQCKMNIRGRAK